MSKRAGARVFDVRTRKVDNNCAFLYENELALGFWTFGRVKSTTVAHFDVKMELALEF